jgi:hypothetical protein
LSDAGDCSTGRCGVIATAVIAAIQVMATQKTPQFAFIIDFGRCSPLGEIP